MFLKWENNSGKLQIISEKFQNCRKFQNNAINDVKQISLSHVIVGGIKQNRYFFRLFKKDSEVSMFRAEKLYFKFNSSFRNWTLNFHSTGNL